MQREPIIFVVTNRSDAGDDLLEAALRQRYHTGYRIEVNASGSDLAQVVQQHLQQEEEIALFIYEADQGLHDTRFLEHTKTVYPKSRLLLFTDDAEVTFSDIKRQSIDYYVGKMWNPPETKLYPIIDELLAEWRASIEMPFVRVKGIMTVRAVRIRLKDTLHRAAEVIALSGVGDLMVIDDDNKFVVSCASAAPSDSSIRMSSGTWQEALTIASKPVRATATRKPRSSS